MAKNHDELMRQIEQDELEDKSHSVTKMSPMEYARARGMQAQLVYYYIRTGKIQDHNCICGRRVLDIEEADAFFKAKAKKV
jgi:hypothetical protein